jgi:hypothetical protein
VKRPETSVKKYEHTPRNNPEERGPIFTAAEAWNLAQFLAVLHTNLQRHHDTLVGSAQLFGIGHWSASWPLTVHDIATTAN